MISVVKRMGEGGTLMEGLADFSIILYFFLIHEHHTESAFISPSGSATSVNVAL